MTRREGPTLFLCGACGHQSPKWEGRCPSCGQWGTLEPAVAPPVRRSSNASAPGASPLQELSSITSQDAPRLALPFEEVNRVLGGGLVPGSVVLMAGEPGIGKSTLLLQAAARLEAAGLPVLYVSGEESPDQLRRSEERRVGKECRL